MVINHLLTGMILQVGFQTPGEKVSFGPQEHTDQTPNIQTIPEVFGRLGFGSKHGIKSFAAAVFFILFLFISVLKYLLKTNSRCWLKMLALNPAIQLP